MADSALAKRKRVLELSNFTRNLNKLIKYIDEGAPASMVKPQYEKMQDCYEKLETAHNDFLGITDIDIETDRDGIQYLDGPDKRHEDAMTRYIAYVKTDNQQEEATRREREKTNRDIEREAREEMERETKAADDAKRKAETERLFETQKVQLSAIIAAFKRLTLNVQDNLKDISLSDKRLEWKNVETEYSALKQQLIDVVGIDHDLDARDITNTFEEDVDKVFLPAKTVVLQELKDAPLTSGGAASSQSSSVSHSLVRREPVSLPKFEGDEKKTPFLDFPVWKEQWDLQIKDYDEHFRIGMLKNHIDEAAKQKIIGYENNYEAAMKRLSKYYGDTSKVVSCVMRDVMSPKEIGEAEYVNLLSYSVVLENNYNRLKVMGYEHEMSNSTAMASILRKFPRSVGERWHEHLSAKTPEEKSKPFPILIEWLISRKEIWEGMATTDQGRSRSANSNYNQGLPACFICGEEGHKHKECPKKRDSRNSNSRVSNKKPRVPPSVKKFWCALHKGDPSRRCFSDSCQELRRLDIQQRVQLLKDNKDCSNCCGDHKLSDCPKPSRVCGGGRSYRGSTKKTMLFTNCCV